MKTQIQLPAEVMQIADNVSIEKRNEVQSVLNHVFNGVSKMREQLEAVVVENENDKTNMKLANTIRLGVRQVRLDAEKTFDAKRADVQAQMLSFKTEDQLWLKAKQTMQILTKEIEEAARWKEETKERFDLEQKELKTQQRMLQMAKVAPEISRVEFENMSDDGFAIFFAQIEKLYQDKIEADRKAEEERIAREKAEAEERERVKAENERLKKEAEEKERQFAAERARIEAQQKEIQRKALEEQRKQEEIIRAERAEKERIQAQLKLKAEAEAKAKEEERAKELALEKAKILAEKKARQAPDKDKLKLLAESLIKIDMPELTSEQGNLILNDVKIMLNKVHVFINTKIQSL